MYKTVKILNENYEQEYFIKSSYENFISAIK